MIGISNLKNLNFKTSKMNSYSTVDYVYREVVEEEIKKGTRGKIFYFNNDQVVDSFEGQIVSLEEVDGNGMFILLNPHHQIRLDRIITIFGKPGPAFDEYDSFANQCLACTGGYDL